MLNNKYSNGSRRPIQHDSWNATIAIQCNGKLVSFRGVSKNPATSYMEPFLISVLSMINQFHKDSILDAAGVLYMPL